MTEKRAQYRKKKKQEELKRLLKRGDRDSRSEKIRKATSDDDLDVNPEFKRDNSPRLRSVSTREDKSYDVIPSKEEKVSRLKRRLNWAIGIVILLIIIVLVILFNF